MRKFWESTRANLPDGQTHLPDMLPVLDHLDQLVMLCDTTRENNIIYMNRAAQETLRRYRERLNSGLRGADVSQAMGRSIHQFHRNPERVRHILAEPHKLPHRAVIPIGDVWFQTRTYAIWHPNRPGEVQCYLACWSDVTAERQVEEQTRREMERKASLEEQVRQIAVAMEEMSATVAEVARNTGEASRSGAVAENAGLGHRVVRQAGDGMRQVAGMVRSASEAVGRLGGQSEQINEIVNVIDEIADQTNLLALNAAIEAARAGDQGRGFAVVADEVRKLAERTAQAIGEISRMIRQVQENTRAAVQVMASSSERVVQGEQLSTQADDVLSRIVADIDSVRGMVGQIAAAKQQAQASQEIAGSLDAVTRL